jgi:hypothetical protein
MTSQATNRREGVSKSCHGRSRKLRAFNEKELESASVAQKLLGTLAIGVGSARPGDGGGGSQRSQKSLPSHPRNVQKQRQNGRFSHFLPKKSLKMLFYT